MGCLMRLRPQTVGGTSPSIRSCLMPASARSAAAIMKAGSLVKKSRYAVPRSFMSLVNTLSWMGVCLNASARRRVGLGAATVQVLTPPPPSIVSTGPLGPRGP